MRPVHRFFLVLAGLCALGAVALLISGGLAATGPAVVGFLAALAVGGRGVARLRQLPIVLGLIFNKVMHGRSGWRRLFSAHG